LGIGVGVGGVFSTYVRLRHVGLLRISIHEL
jgi:hypothetical protein